MTFSETTLVLKQVDGICSVDGRQASGIARLEREEDVATFFLSLVNLKALSGNGEYVAYISDGNNDCSVVAVGKRPCSVSETLNEGAVKTEDFACAVAVLADDIPTVILFKRTENSKISLSDMRKIIAEKCLSARKERLKEKAVETLAKKPETPDFSREKSLETANNTLSETYDDEAVATENFYSLEQKIEEKVNAIGRIENEKLRTENGGNDSVHQEEEKESATADYCFENEICDSIGEEDEEWEGLPFFLREKDELNELFSKFPEEENLCKLFPESKWVKINYSENKYYVVGLVKEDKKEKYICYGVPATYSEDAPPELDGYCSFVPLSFFDMKGDGYWMMFQDAITGECVHLNKHNAFKK